MQRPPGQARPLAVIPLEPAELPEIEFERTVDGLDEVLAADVEIPGGWILTLARYRGAPTPGINVYVHAEENQMAAALDALTSALNVRRSQLPWVSPLAR